MMLTDDERREVTGVPMVRVLDGNGREVARGWYIRHENRQPAPLGDRLRPEDVDHLVAMDGFADWGMPRELKIKRITPPHRIEVLAESEIDREALLELADELEEDACWEVQTPGNTSVTRRLKETCDRIRDALGVEK